MSSLVRSLVGTTACCLLAFGWLVQSPPAVARGSVQARTVAEGLDFPAGIAFSRDGTMFVTERTGRIRVGRDGQMETLAQIPTTTEGETGLLGIAVSPDDRFVYAFATTPDGATNRVYRVPVAGGPARVVVDGLPASVYHNGGGVAFDDEGMLLVSNGEQHDDSKSQDPQVLGGKVYRFTPTGGIPGDNPFGDSPALAIGLRNPFGLTVDPVSGDAFVTENGPDAFDEINHIVRGGNYGWPVFSGPAGDQGAAQDLTGSYQDPLLDYENIVVPTGITVADPRNARRGFGGDLFFATYGEQTIHRVRLDSSRSRAVSDDVFLRSSAPVVGLAWGPDGLYYSTGTSPGAVRVIPLAAPERRERTEPRRGGGDRGTPTPSDEPTVAREPDAEQGAPTRLILVGAAVLVALAVIGFVFLRPRPKP